MTAERPGPITPSTELKAYLARIGYEGVIAPALETLRGMHRAHFVHVPFENLNIQRGIPIVTDHASVFDKVVRRRRGGFCLELSSLFAWALREIGFQVDILGGRVLQPNGTLSEPLSHMTLLVHLDAAEQDAGEQVDWIADVGFGGRLIEPLQLAKRAVQIFGDRSYAMANDGDHYLVTIREPGQAADAPSLYLFTLQPRSIDEFDSICHWLQTAPDSTFTRGDLATLGLPTGRVSYAPGRPLLTDANGPTELPVADDEVDGVLRQHFGIDLSIT